MNHLQKDDIFAPGEKILTKYTVLQKIGEGSFGQVYKCLLELKQEEVAIKVLRRKEFNLEPGLFDLFKRELRILSQLDCPYICKYISLEQDQDYYYLVVQFCNDGNLAQKIRQIGSQTISVRTQRKIFYLDEKTALSYMRQILRAFQYMHAFRKDKVLHRDIKLENIFLQKDPENDNESIVKVGDFGFARSLSDGQVATTFLGSPLTMAPEIAERKVYDVQCDMYSLGAMLYQMLFGEFPYVHPQSGNQPHMIAQLVKKGNLDFQRNGIRVSPETEDLVRKMLIYDPTQRISFADAFRHPLIAIEELNAHPSPQESDTGHNQHQHTGDRFDSPKSSPDKKRASNDGNDAKSTATSDDRNGKASKNNPPAVQNFAADDKYSKAQKIKVIGDKSVGKSEVVKALQAIGDYDGTINTFFIDGQTYTLAFEESKTSNSSVTNAFIRETRIFFIVVDLERETGNSLTQWIKLVREVAEKKASKIVVIGNERAAGGGNAYARAKNIQAICDQNQCQFKRVNAKERADEIKNIFIATLRAIVTEIENKTNTNNSVTLRQSTRREELERK